MLIGLHTASVCSECCPDLKGIKTADISAFRVQICSECCPDLKGIKTLDNYLEVETFPFLNVALI